ncbi:DUF3006 domain-containing protein [Bacillus horti]|uniref:DUF3006 domain-containing protein n=1 Tax=Caldalkalibacillus horti TaxID=77523 RepID=A0ABT9W2Q8_9BACI|nr:DUF3006 domain-containing protein [Bacillus horti]MDQ0167523.1 hypothetical protein [Bacillus horti]
MMKKSGVIDRIVDQRLAVLLVDEQEELIVPIEELPSDVFEGSWLIVTFDGEKRIHVEKDMKKTVESKQRIATKLEQLREKKGSNFKRK